ncbi:MAG: hypothetical protein MUO72_20585 [Bacteroidales bacterium]|nr:hypothetical protein [Bacteroidales bacterium]
MKKLLMYLVVISITFSAFAQSPQKMSYQAVIRDASNALVTSHAVGMRISILQGSVSGTVVYTETQTPTTNANGLVTIEIGGGTGFDAINWANGQYFIKTETDPTGGTSYTITGTNQLLSVPYSLYSTASGSATDAVKLTGDQTIAGNKTFTGRTTVPTPVNGTDAVTKAYADNLKNIIYEEMLNSGFNGFIKDIEGNYYKTIKIGNQVWMAENLKTTKYNDGTALELVTEDGDWKYQNDPAYCWYNNDAAAYKKCYGALYKWNVMDYYESHGRNICPAGWHVPTDAEWTTLTDYLGGNAGFKLKEVGTAYWDSYNTEATNESGFTARPGGSRTENGIFISEGSGCFWWTSTEYASPYAWYRRIGSNDAVVTRSNIAKQRGLSIRCLRD